MGVAAADSALRFALFAWKLGIQRCSKADPRPAQKFLDLIAMKLRYKFQKNKKFYNEDFNN